VKRLASPDWATSPYVIFPQSSTFIPNGRCDATPVNTAGSVTGQRRQCHISYFGQVCVARCAEIFDEETGVEPPADGWSRRWPLKAQAGP
jgi:hypothetical protein